MLAHRRRYLVGDARRSGGRLGRDRRRPARHRRSASRRTSRATTTSTHVVIWSALWPRRCAMRRRSTFAAMGGLFSERSRRREHRPRGDDADGRLLRASGAPTSTGSWAARHPHRRCCPAMSLALVHAFFCIHLRADQIVIGTGINFLALGITGYALRGHLRRPEGMPAPASREIPDVTSGPSGLRPFLGAVFGNLNLMIWLSFLLVLAVLHRHLQDADRPAHARRGRASARRRHGRHLGVRRRATPP